MQTLNYLIGAIGKGKADKDDIKRLVISLIGPDMEHDRENGCDGRYECSCPAADVNDKLRELRRKVEQL